MAWLSMRVVLLTVTTEPNARSIPPLTPGAPTAAAAAGPALSDVVSERTAGHEGRRDGDQGDTAPFPDTAGAAGRPGAADSLIAGERTVGNGRGGGGTHRWARQKMPPPATALPFETVCDGTAPGASGVPMARLLVTVELLTIKFAKLLMPPPCPEPKLVTPSPPASPIAALPLSVQPVTVMVAPTLRRIADRTSARTGAGAAALAPGSR